MSTRLSRKNRTVEDLGILSSGGLMDLFDNQTKIFFRLNDNEYDFLCDQIEDEDEDFSTLFGSTKVQMTFPQKRKMLIMLKELTDKYEQTTAIS